MRFWFTFVTFAALGFAASPAAVHRASPELYSRVGQARYEECEFRQAAGAFENALKQQPSNAGLHHWLGKTYARMADVANLLHAPSHARKARLHLERAVELAPRNQEFLRDLFDFYLDSPEWLNGGLERAALLLERITPDDPVGQQFLRQHLDAARKESSGAGWWLRQPVLLPSREISYLSR